MLLNYFEEKEDEKVKYIAVFKSLTFIGSIESKKRKNSKYKFHISIINRDLWKCVAKTEKDEIKEVVQELNKGNRKVIPVFSKWQDKNTFNPPSGNGIITVID